MGHPPIRHLIENSTVQFNIVASSHFPAQIRKVLQNVLSNGNGNDQTPVKGA